MEAPNLRHSPLKKYRLAFTQPKPMQVAHSKQAMSADDSEDIRESTPPKTPLYNSVQQTLAEETQPSKTRPLVPRLNLERIIARQERRKPEVLPKPSALPEPRQPVAVEEQKAAKPLPSVLEADAPESADQAHSLSDKPQIDLDRTGLEEVAEGPSILVDVPKYEGPTLAVLTAAVDALPEPPAQKKSVWVRLCACASSEEDSPLTTTLDKLRVLHRTRLSRDSALHRDLIEYMQQNLAEEGLIACTPLTLLMVMATHILFPTRIQVVQGVVPSLKTVCSEVMSVFLTLSDKVKQFDDLSPFSACVVYFAALLFICVDFYQQGETPRTISHKLRKLALKKNSMLNSAAKYYTVMANRASNTS